MKPIFRILLIIMLIASVVGLTPLALVFPDQRDLLVLVQAGGAAVLWICVVFFIFLDQISFQTPLTHGILPHRTEDSRP